MCILMLICNENTRVELLDHRVSMCSNLIDIFRNLSNAVVPVYILTSSIFASLPIIDINIICLFNGSHSGVYVVESHWGFNLHFPDEK